MKTTYTITFFSTGFGIDLQPKGRFCKKSKLKIKPVFTKEQYKQAQGR